MGKTRQIVMVLILLITASAWNITDVPKDKRTWGDYTWGAWGGDREASRLGREELMARENYCPTGGCVIRLDAVTVKPQNLRRGDTLQITTSYTILTPEQIAIPVTITREILFQGKSLGKSRSMETRKLNGAWDHETNFSLPANAAAGDYVLVTVISTGYGQDRKTVQFRVAS